MASATKRPSGKYLGRYRGPDGKERTKTFDRRKDALAWANEQERRVRVRDWSDPARGKITVAELCDQWRTTWNLTPKTRLSYESLLGTCVLARWGKTRIDHIEPSAVRTWVAGMTGTRGTLLSASRRRQACHLLTAMLDMAVEDGRLPKNPARSQSGQRQRGFLPKLPSQVHHRYLRHEDLQRLAEVAGEYRTLVLLLGYCGLRWSEAAGLRVRSVDALRGRLTISGSLQEVSGALVDGPTKTHASRTVPVPAFLRPELERLLEGKGRDDLLFQSPQGGALRHANFRNRVWLPALRATGLTGLRIHDLRHTAASLAVASGANVKAVQRMLGHKDAAMTLNVYADLFDGDLDDVAERMDDAYQAALTAVPDRTVRPLTGTA